MEKQKRNAWKELLPGLFLALCMPLLTWMGYPDLEPHSGGGLFDLVVLLVGAAFALLVHALFKRRWIRMLALLIALCVGFACFNVASRAMLCPDCDAQYYNEIHGIE